MDAGSSLEESYACVRAVLDRTASCSLESIGREARRLSQAVRSRQWEEEGAAGAMEAIAGAARDVWGPQAKVELCGSRGAGIALAGADVDIAVERGEALLPGRGERARLCTLLAEVLNGTGRGNVAAITGALVPVVKGRVEGMQVDASVGSRDNVQAREWLQKELANAPAAKDVIVASKWLLQREGLLGQDRAGIGGFHLATVVLVVARRLGVERRTGELLVATAELMGGGWSRERYAFSPREGGWIAKGSMEGPAHSDARCFSAESPLSPLRDLARPPQHHEEVANLFRSLADALTSGDESRWRAFLDPDVTTAWH